MAIEVSIDGKTGDEHKISHVAAAWAVAAVDVLGRGLLWIIEKVQGVRCREGKRNHMQLIESLALGNRRQLLLVVCGNQRYLVGAGADSVSSILAVEPGAAPGESAGQRARTRPRSMGRTVKGPELVRHRGRQVATEHEAGAGLWP